MERIVITFKNDGSFRGASITDFDGSPQPLDEAALALLFPTLNAAAINYADAVKAEYDAKEPGTEYMKNIRIHLKDDLLATNKQKVDAIQLEVDAWAAARKAQRQAELQAEIDTANAELAAKEAELLALANDPIL